MGGIVCERARRRKRAERNHARLKLLPEEATPRTRAMAEKKLGMHDAKKLHGR
jgi:hypothetical protein